MQYELDINFANKTNYTLKFQLHPNPQYGDDSAYHVALNNTTIRMSTFSIKSDTIHYWDKRRLVFDTKDLTIAPSVLFSQVFDSLSITIPNGSNLVLRFNHNIANHYYFNPFTKDSIWSYKENDTYLPSDNCETPIQISDYTFIIDTTLIKK